MARRSRASGSNSSIIVLVILAVTTWTHRTWIIYALYGLVAFGALAIGFNLLRIVRFRYRRATISDIDRMHGLDFERYIADLLGQHGFTNILLTEHYDIGIDIIAERDGLRWGIQVKRFSGLVKANAVRQVVTALRAYGCERAMVISNSSYSQVARRLAASNDCVLIGRTELQRMIWTRKGKYLLQSLQAL